MQILTKWREFTNKETGIDNNEINVKYIMGLFLFLTLYSISLFLFIKYISEMLREMACHINIFVISTTLDLLLSEIFSLDKIMELIITNKIINICEK
mgnify:CR=1 FL=1